MSWPGGVGAVDLVDETQTLRVRCCLWDVVWRCVSLTASVRYSDPVDERIVLPVGGDKRHSLAGRSGLQREGLSVEGFEAWCDEDEDAVEVNMDVVDADVLGESGWVDEEDSKEGAVAIARRTEGVEGSCGHGRPIGGR